MSEISETEIKSMSKLENYMRGYKDGKNDVLDKIRDEILDEKEYAYADFEQYKIDYLGVDVEYVEDELPHDDFRYGMERCIEIIDKYKEKNKERIEKVNQELIEAAQKIKQFCYNTYNCHSCPLKKDGSCLLLDGEPESWEV